MKDYCVKPGYQSNPNPEIHTELMRGIRDGRRPIGNSIDDSLLYQVPVYRRAAELAQHPDVTSVLDIGCGLGTKLMQLVAPHCETVTGVDLPDTIALCLQLHPLGHWLVGDVRDPSFSIDGRYDLIISADVIEHLVDPDRLLDVIQSASHKRTQVILSTPERDLRRGKVHMGPPRNRAHVREWNEEEFHTYLESRSFEMSASCIVDLREGVPTCQMVVGRFRRGDT